MMLSGSFQNILIFWLLAVSWACVDMKSSLWGTHICMLLIYSDMYRCIVAMVTAGLTDLRG